MPKTVNPSYGLDEQDKTDGYVGVTEEYQNAANETEIPHPFEEDDLYDADNHREDASEDDESDDESDDAPAKRSAKKASGARQAAPKLPTKDEQSE